MQRHIAQRLSTVRRAVAHATQRNTITHIIRHITAARSPITTSCAICRSSFHSTSLSAIAASSTSATPSKSSPTATASVQHSFRELGIESEFLLQRLKKLGIQYPTDIQARAVPKILGTSSVLVGAETGCGKTLAYILPVLEQLLRITPTEENPDGDAIRVQTNRSFPRVIIFQPNRELAAQLESVLQSLIGPSGSAIPVGNGQTVKLHYASLLGTHIFPIQSRPQIDILITTPRCLSENLPYHDLSRARAKRNKAEAILRAAGADELDETQQQKLLSSSRSVGHGRFDMVDFIRATQTVILDEVDFLLEGDQEKSTKQWIEDVWMKQRTKEEKYGQLKRERVRIDSANDPTSTARPIVRNPQQPDRQFIFVGATLANFSPRTSFQYLLDIFTPYTARPKHEPTGKPLLGARSLAVEDLPKECTLSLVLTERLHHLHLELVKSIQWVHVGPSEHHAQEIDESKLEELVKNENPGDVDERDLSEDKIGQKEDVYSDDATAASAAASTSTSTSNQPYKRPVGSFPRKNREPYDSRPRRNEGDETKEFLLKEDADAEKVRELVQFLNRFTPPPSASTNDASTSTSAPPRKSLLFVSSTSRLRALERVLLAAQSSSHAAAAPKDPSIAHLISGLRLDSGVELIPYHAELKPGERTQAMERFNSASPATETRVIGKAPAHVTHQVLLCTSLVARGLDFNKITPPPMPRQITKHQQAQQQIRPGFTSLVQFDLAKNVTEYIHRVGRMWRVRNEAEKEEKLTEDAVVDASTTTKEVDFRVLNLYTAVDELLVSHIRRVGDGSSAAAADHQAIADEGFIPNDAFSRNRRLRHVAKRRQQKLLGEGTEKNETNDPASEARHDSVHRPKRKSPSSMFGRHEHEEQIPLQQSRW